MKKPAFQFYTGDWAKDPGVKRLSPREKGVYLELLILMFDSEGYVLPMSDRDLMHCINFRTEDSEETCSVDAIFRKVLDRLFECGVIHKTEDGRLYNKRILRDLEEKDELSQKRSEAGKLGNEKRWGENRKPNRICDNFAIANTSQGAIEKNRSSTSTSTSSSTSVLKEKINKKENLSPGTLPQNEQEAVDMCMGTPVPEWFIKERAYPTAVAEGFKTAAGNIIASWPQWVTNYWNNWDNAQRRQNQKPKQEGFFNNKPLKEIKIDDDEHREECC